jgi:putative membrane protein
VIRTLTLAAVAALATSAYAQDSSSVPLGDEYFAMKAYSEGMAEVVKSQLAIERATQPAIKAFAERMVKDHTKCNNEIVELARKKGIALPATVDPIHTAVINRMARMSGSDFDKAYLKAQMCAHMDALHLFGHESRKGEDTELKQLAHKAMATLQDHAKEAFELAGEKQEYQKFYKIHEYAKQVMEEK